MLTCSIVFTLSTTRHFSVYWDTGAVLGLNPALVPPADLPCADNLAELLA